MTGRQGCVLVSVSCRTCARGLAGVIVTTEVPDWAALCASTQTACKVTGVIDHICECLDFINAPAAMQIYPALQSGKEKRRDEGAGGGARV